MRKICCLILIICALCPLCLSALGEEEIDVEYNVPQVLTQERFQELTDRISALGSGSEAKKFVRYFRKVTIVRLFEGGSDEILLGRHLLAQSAQMGEPYAEELLARTDSTAISEGFQYVCDILAAFAASHDDAAILEKTFYLLSGTPQRFVIESIHANLSQIGYSEEEYASDLRWETAEEDLLWIAVKPDGTAAVVLYGGDAENVALPSAYQGCPVTEILRGAFLDSLRKPGLKVQTVQVPDTVTKIGDYAFAYCRWLKEITLPACIQEIGDSVFFGLAGQLMVIVSPGSAAERYCAENGISCQYAQ